MHTPVLLEESIKALNVRKDGRYIDATYGLGGHSRAIAQAGGLVLGIDWDQGNVANSTERGTPANVILVHGNYANIKKIAQENNWVPCQGIIFDLGLSMDQIRSSQRGFSYEARSEPLDMRIDISLKTTASDIINSSSEQELYDIFAKNAEEINSRSIAHAIYIARRLNAIVTVGGLIDAINSATKDRKAVARIFQALRVEVNDEFNNIRQGLLEGYEILDRDGRIVIITFHQSEDRIVKQYAREHGMKMLTAKPIKSSSHASFERSAHLRIIQKN